MLFLRTWQLVVERKKTATRRLIKGRVGASAHADGADITYHDLAGYRVGQHVAVMPARGVRGLTKVADFAIARLGEYA